MEMYECPKFLHCSASLCPLDPDWRKRTSMNGEPTCFYLCEYVKDGSKARFEGSSHGKIYEACSRMMSERHLIGGNVRHVLDRASRSGARMGKPFDRRRHERDGSESRV